MLAPAIDTLQTFTALSAIRTSWRGAFVLGIGMSHAGPALAKATLGLGAASLFLEESPALLHAAQREGCCDFVVTTLDEALRALKNELRQQHAISIGLHCNINACLAEFVARGVVPQILASETPAPIDTLLRWGTQPIHGPGLHRLSETSIDLGAWLAAMTKALWQIETDQAVTMSQRREQDAALLLNYPSDDPIHKAMRQWLATAPTLFPRDKDRPYWRQTDER